VVMRAVQGLSGTRTLIMIAHRLTSLAGADTVHVLEGGRIVASGPPGQVLPQVARAGDQG
jgi:ABC-type multidrug transport system fused ATPase/permease subunit